MLAQLDDDRLGHHLAPVNLRWLAPVDRGVPAHLPIAMNGHPEKTPAPIRCFTISSISAAVFFCLTTLHPLNAKSCPTCACCDDHERDRKHGADDVHVERDAGVAGCEVPRYHHLSDVPDSVAAQTAAALNERSRQNATQAVTQAVADLNPSGEIFAG
jgi:hypothetical protein